MKVLKFRPDMLELVMAGKKTATTRTRKHGEPGDVLVLENGAKVRLLRVFKTTLQVVARHYYRHEGFDSPAGFVKVWQELHPRKGWQGLQVVWLYLFKLEEVSDG